jgi:ribosomal protein S27AE
MMDPGSGTPPGAPVPFTADELRQRHRRFERGKSIVTAIGAAPFLLLYVSIHTRYLRPYVSENRSVAVLQLILLPIAWFAAVTLLYRWSGPLRHRLQCPRCGAALVGKALDTAAETRQCGHCGAPLVRDAGPPGPPHDPGRTAT